MGGSDFFSNGIHLNVIEAADDPAAESWRNLRAIDDVVREIIETDSHLVISALARRRRRGRRAVRARGRPRGRARGRRAEPVLPAHGRPVRLGVLDLPAAAPRRRRADRPAHRRRRSRRWARGRRSRSGCSTPPSGPPWTASAPRSARWPSGSRSDPDVDRWLDGQAAPARARRGGQAARRLPQRGAGPLVRVLLRRGPQLPRGAPALRPQARRTVRRQRRRPQRPRRRRDARRGGRRRRPASADRQAEPGGLRVCEMMSPRSEGAMGSSAVTTRHTWIDTQLASWRSTRPGRLMLLAVSIALVAGVYYAAAKIGLRLATCTARDGAVASCRGRDRRAGALRAAAVARHRHRRPAGRRLLDAAGDGARPDGWATRSRCVVAAVLLRRLIGDRTGLERVGDVLALVAAAAVGTLISASFGAASLRLGDVIPADQSGRSGARGGCRTSRARSWSRR